jgi:hypothetical protein
MRDTYLHRLSRPYRPAVTGGSAPGRESPSLRVVVGTHDLNERGSAGQDPDDRVDALGARYAEPERSADSRRSRPVEACEVCGRTLLAGERAREIVREEHVVQACPLCVIGAQRAARAQAA